MPTFTDETIRDIFGADAAEDEEPERLKAFFYKNKSYNNIRSALPLRLLVGHKGIGKSALLRMSYIEDGQDGDLALWIQPNVLKIDGLSGKRLVDKIELYKARILSLVLEKSLEKMQIFDEESTYTYQSSATRIIYQLQRFVFNKVGVDADAEAQELRRKFTDQKRIFIYIDDIDRGWSASPEDISNISALINAARDLSNEERNLKFRIGLRTDAYFLYRTSDESTDKIEGSVVRLSWTNHDILVVMAMRVARFFNRSVDMGRLEQLPQIEIAKELHSIIEPRFATGRGHWDNAPIHKVLLSLTRKRPRDLIKLLSGAAKRAFENDRNVISSSDLESTFANYSNERINDICLEFRSELPNIEKLLYNMKPTTARQKERKKNFLYTNDELLKKLKNITQNHNIKFQNGQLATPKALAEFMYKIDFILARDDSVAGKPKWIYFDQNTMLQKQFVDFGFHWEVHPAYRWALNPKGIQQIIDEIDVPRDV